MDAFSMSGEILGRLHREELLRQAEQHRLARAVPTRNPVGPWLIGLGRRMERLGQRLAGEGWAAPDVAGGLR